MKNLITTILFTSFFNLTTFAGDKAELQLIGFSVNGKYMAFEQYGIQDGSGFPYSEIFIVDVIKNSYIDKPFKLVVEDEQASLQTVRDKNLESAKQKLIKIGIINQNRGLIALNQPLPSKIDENKFEEVEFKIKNNSYILTLKETDTDKNCYDLGFERLIELKLKNQKTKKVALLQKDKKVPKSRECALGYRIHYVYVYDKYITVFLNVYRPGFEGANMRYMVVTGKLI